MESENKETVSQLNIMHCQKLMQFTKKNFQLEMVTNITVQREETEEDMETEINETVSQVHDKPI